LDQLRGDKFTAGICFGQYAFLHYLSFEVH
jgi:hypothetical protein